MDRVDTILRGARGSRLVMRVADHPERRNLPGRSKRGRAPLNAGFRGGGIDSHLVSKDRGLYRKKRDLAVVKPNPALADFRAALCGHSAEWL